MQSTGSKLRIAGCLAAIMVCALALSACTGILGPQGPIGAAEKSILIDSVAIMLAIVAPTIAAIFAFAWWFRASNSKARHLPYRACRLGHSGACRDAARRRGLDRIA
jgi:hypothetical protein